MVPSRPWRMTRIQTRILHVHPTAGIHQRGTLRYCGVLRAGAPPAMVWRTRVLLTRSEATVERCMEAAQTTRRSRRSGPAEEGRSRRTGGGSGPTTSIRSAGGAFTNRMTADTPRASGHCMRTLHMHMGRYDHPEVVLTLFRSIFKVMPLNCRFNQRIKGSATSVVASSFELNHCVLLPHLGIRT